MPIFNPTPPPTNDPTYGGGSRPTEYRSNRTSEALFSGIGDVLNATVKGGVAITQNAIDEELYQRIDQERDAVGVAAIAADAANSGNAFDEHPTGTSREAPPDFNFLLPQMERLQQSFVAGKVSPTYYYGRLETIARSMRARYPGFRDYIDSKISNITGVTPANALRASIYHDMAQRSESGKTEQEKRMDLIVRLKDDLPPDFDTASFLNPGSNISKEQVIAMAGRTAATRAVNRSILNQYQVDAAQDGHQETTAKKAFTSLGNNIVTAFLNNSMDKQGGYQAIVNEINAIRSGSVPLDDTRTRELAMRLRLGIDGVLAQIRKAGTDIVSPNVRPPLAVINPTEAEKMMESMIHLPMLLLKGLEGGDAPLIDAALSMSKGIQQNAMLAAMKDQNILAINTLREAGGPQLADRYAMDKMNAIQKSIANANFAKMATQVTGRVNPFTMKQAVAQATEVSKEDGTLPSNEVNEAIVTSIEQLKDPKLSPFLKQGLATAAYTPGNMGFIMRNVDPGSQDVVYERLTDPSITNIIKGMGNDTIQNYVGWSINEFRDILRRDIKAVRNSPETGVRVDFNPQTGRLEFIGGSGIQGSQVVNRINRMLGNLSHVLDLTGDNAPNKLLEILMSEGFNPNAPEEPGVFTAIVQSMYNAIVNSPESLAKRQQEAREREMKNRRRLGE